MTDNEQNRHLTTGEWFVTLLLLSLPLVGLILLFVWGFGDGNISRRNLCRAYLLWFAIALAIGLVVLLGFVLFGGLLAAAASSAAP